ncbi:MAG: hypothetical protein HQ481_14355 [Alphaproteobacteria bacterium]|nr:hypothetical protein [Alphaproteobacteria bacterium]
MTAQISTPISAGELIDKITILSIKSERMSDPTQRANVLHELSLLEAVRDDALKDAPALDDLITELKTINEALWVVEDDIRECERAEEFGPRFVSLARSVYRTNDRRAALKRAINERLGSEIMEEKSYSAY